MIGVILAAGQGTRLKPLTDNLPKCLLAVGGKTIIFRQIKALWVLGIKDVIVVVGYKGDLVKEHIVKECPFIQVTFITNDEYATTNNLYSLGLAMPYIHSSYILLNGDTVFHPEALKKIVNHEAGNCLGIVHKKKCIPEDMKVAIAAGRIINIGKDLFSFTEFMGMAKFDFFGSGFLRVIEKQKKTDWFEAVIKYLINDIVFIAVDITNYPSIEIDYVEDLQKAKEMFIWGMPEWEVGIRHGSDVNVENAKRLLFDLLDLLDEHKIKYWFNWGLLLGAFRDKGFIPWDTDIDVTCHWEDRDKVIQLIEPEMLKKGCFIPSEEVCFPEDRWYIRDMEKIELNFVETHGDRYIYSPKRCPLGCHKKYLDTLLKMDFLGREVTIPNETEEYLRLSYGDDFMTPIKDKKPKSL